MKKRITHTYRIVWRGITLQIRHQPLYFDYGADHIEIHVKKPKDAIIPITETGYRSHFIDEEELKQAGGPVAFVTAWLDREGNTKKWIKRELASRQLELFPK